MKKHLIHTDQKFEGVKACFTKNNLLAESNEKHKLQKGISYSQYSDLKQHKRLLAFFANAQIEIK